LAGRALPGRLTWQLATVVELVRETYRTTTIVLDAPMWAGHKAGQHIDVRLTAEDGYTAQRSYSIASGPEDRHLMLTVERIDDGEVSPYLVEELRAGDELELRGPIGGYFIWEEAVGGPVLMLAGGSGVVPFRSMLREWVAAGGDVPARLIYSSRAPRDVIYMAELEMLAARDGLEIDIVLTREWPEDWKGPHGRVDAALLDMLAWGPANRPHIYICGPNGFVEAISQHLVMAGHDPRQIRTERFGPSGS
jgi:ferredoxin-NADP reductase